MCHAAWGVRSWLLICICLAAMTAAGGADSRRTRQILRAEAYLAAGNLDNAREAAQFYQGAIDTDAGNVLIGGESHEALDTIDPALGRPDDAGLIMVRAVQLLDTRRNADSLQQARQLGMAQALAGQPLAARDSLARALKSPPPDSHSSDSYI